MTPEEHEAINRLFHRVCDLTAADRAAVLDAACSGQETRREVEALLAADDALADRESAPDAEPPSSPDAPTTPLEVGSDSRPSPGLRSHSAKISAAEPRPPFPAPAGIETRGFGDYELLDEIDRGGMGVVYKARQSSLKRTVALKMILSGKFAGEAEVQRFQIEAEAAASLQHPNIVAIHEVGEHEGHHYFSMEYVEGESLADLLRRHPLSARHAAECIKTVAEAVHYAHTQGTLHRDLKPSNVLIDTSGEPRITDFGLAKRIEGDSKLTASGMILGTPSYMSPEQAAGKELGPASDVYSLGAVIYELVVGRPPFLAESPLETLKQVAEAAPASPRSFNPRIPRDLETICLKCLEKEPRRRYVTASELVAELERFLRGEPIRARPVSGLSRGWRWCRRNPQVAVVSALALAAILGLSVLYYLSLTAENARTRLAAFEARAHLTRSLFEQARSTLASEKIGSRAKALELLKEAERVRKLVEAGRTNFSRSAATPYLENVPPRRDLRGAAVEALLIDTLLDRELDISTGASSPLPPGSSLVGTAVSPDGALLALTWQDPQGRQAGVRVIDLRTGEEVERWNTDSHGASGTLAISNNGRLLASQSSGPEVTLRDIPSGKVRGTFEGPECPDRVESQVFASPTVLLALDLNADGRYLGASWLCIPDDGRSQQRTQPQFAKITPADLDDVAFTSAELRLWDIRESVPLATIRLEQDPWWLFSPSGKRLCYLTGPKTIAIRDLDAPANSKALTLPFKVRGPFAVDANDRLLAMVTDTADARDIVVWDLENNIETTRFSSTGPPRSIVLSPTGGALLAAVTGESPGVVLYGIAEGPLARRLETLDGRHQAHLLRWLPDGRRLVTSASKAEPPTLWSVLDPPSRRVLPQGGSAFAFSPNGRHVAFTRRDDRREVQVFDRVTGDVYRTLSTEYLTERLVYRDDGQELAGWSPSGAVIWDLATGRESARLRFVDDSMAPGKRSVEDTLRSAAFSEDGALLVCGRRARTSEGLGLWNVTSGERLTDLSKYTGVARVHLSPDGKQLVVVATHLEVLALPELRVLGTWQPHTPEVVVDPALVGFSADRRWIALCHRVDPEASRWRESGSPLQLDTPRGEETVERPLNSRTAFASGSPGTGPGITLWSLPRGEQRIDLGCRAEPVSLDFDAQGRVLAVGCLDGTVELWEISAQRRWFHARVLPRPVVQVDLLTAGTKLAVGDGSSSVEILDLPSLVIHLSQVGLEW